MVEMQYWIWLSLACTPGSKTFIKLYEQYESPKVIYDLVESDYRSVLTSENSDIEKLLNKDLTKANEILTFCREKGVGIFLFDDPKFPEKLKQISAPPVLLYYRGTLPDYDSIFPVAVVGTRKMTDYGKKSAFYTSLDLAKAGATIVSGMALGIDSVALAAAAAIDKPTVTFLGSGINVVYPAEHLKLARKLVEKGCIFTEYAPGEEALGYHFPVRNRLIAGFSATVAVIEGRENSGARSTARRAFDMGKTVYALPGSVDREMSELTTMLLREKAKAFRNADDIVRDFEFQYPGIVNPFNLNTPVSVSMDKILSEYGVTDARHATGRGNFRRRKNEAKSDSLETPKIGKETPKLSGLQAKIYEKIPPNESIAIEALTDVEVSIREVMKVLLKLEIANAVVLLPGERVSRVI